MNTAYQTFLESKEWKQLRYKVILRDKQCVCCGIRYKQKSKYQVHHRHYDSGLLNIKTLITLCSSCHYLVHHKDGIRLANDKKTLLQSLNNLKQKMSVTKQKKLKGYKSSIKKKKKRKTKYIRYNPTAFQEKETQVNLRREKIREQLRTVKPKLIKK